MEISRYRLRNRREELRNGLQSRFSSDERRTITSLRASLSTAKVDNGTYTRFNNTCNNVILINPVTELHE